MCNGPRRLSNLPPGVKESEIDALFSTPAELGETCGTCSCKEPIPRDWQRIGHLPRGAAWCPVIEEWVEGCFKACDGWEPS